MSRLPALFVSHGAPTLVVERDSPARAFLLSLGACMPRPRAILSVTAHWTTPEPVLGSAALPGTIHDFYGFPDALYDLAYEAEGAPDVASRGHRLLHGAGISASEDPRRGLDHGTWVPLMLIYPHADIPVAQLSVQPAKGAAWHLDLGRRLAPLIDDGVLIIASGGQVHNLGDFRPGAKQPAPWATAFADWLDRTVEAGDHQAMADYRTQAPDAKIAHPTDEHLLPLMVAMGAGGGAGRVLHKGFEHGSLGMGAYAFPKDAMQAIP